MPTSRQIILKGGEWYAGMGTESSKGTKVFALTGDVNNVGLVEVPMGTTLGDIIYDIGGGIPTARNSRPCRLGGPSGGCIPASTSNTPVDYESIVKLGAIMGSGGLIVMDEDNCMVDVARFFLEFCQDESCGKCTPCRVGTKRMLEILTRICNGEGKEGDIELLEKLADIIKDSVPVRAGPDRAQPGAFHHPVFPGRVRGPHLRQEVPGGGLLGAVQGALPARLPDRHGRPGIHRPDQGRPAGRRLQGLLRKTNPFPRVCGRVCNQFCAHQVPPRPDGRTDGHRLAEAVHYR